MTTHRHHTLVLLIATAALTFSACGNNEDNNNDNNVIVIIEDMNGTQDMNDMTVADMTPDVEEDIPTFGDDMDNNNSNDERRQQVIKEWPLLDKTAPANAITVTEENGVFTATIDATAGGFMGGQTNPFVYFDLDKGEQVMITDLESLTNKTWELAFKRVAIRTNSGDSGDADVELALFENTTFDAVTDAPTSDNQYAVDKTLDDQNMVRVDNIGIPYTAFNELNLLNPSGSQSWYDYNMSVTPTPGDVYVLRNTSEQATVKFQLVSWKSGVFEFKWSKLN